MSKHKNNGGPAYPQTRPIHNWNGHKTGDEYIAGKSKRDSFAEQALVGLLAHPTRYCPPPFAGTLDWHEEVAREAYEIADAMLAEGAKAKDGAQ